MSLMLDPAKLARYQADENQDYYDVGQAHGMLVKEADTPVAAPVLHGRLIITPENWGMIAIPAALVRGIFDALDAPGIELPLRDGRLRGHITVFRPEDIKAIGGADKISERGHPFYFQLGPIKKVRPSGWDDVSLVYLVEVSSPELKKLRVSYGLTPLPSGDHPFHITVATVKKHTLRTGPTSKVANVEAGDGQARVPRSVQDPGVSELVADAAALRGVDEPRLQELGRSRDHGVSKLAAALHGLLPGHGGPTTGDDPRAQGQQQGLLQGQLCLGVAKDPGAEHADQPVGSMSGQDQDGRRMGRTDRHAPDDDPWASGAGLDGRGSHSRTTRKTAQDNALVGSRWLAAIADGVGQATRDKQYDSERTTKTGREFGRCADGSEKRARSATRYAHQQDDHIRWRDSLFGGLGRTSGHHSEHTPLPAAKVANVHGHDDVKAATLKAAADESDEDEDDETSDSTRPKKEIRLPLVMRRIVMTTISCGEPDGDDDGIKEFMDRLRARSRKTSEKHADARSILVPGMVGAGLGGLGGYGYGQISGSDNPWHDVLLGGGLGGLVGASLGARQVQSAPPSPWGVERGSSAPGDAPAGPYVAPAGSRTGSLPASITHYYKGVKGGFAKVLADAEKHQAPYVPGETLIPWKAEDIKAKIPITELTREQAQVAAGRANIPLGTELHGWTDPRIDEAARGGGPSTEITLVKQPGMQEFEEHELGHAGFQSTPRVRFLKDPKTTKADLANIVDEKSGIKLVRALGGKPTMWPGFFSNYATSKSELDPRMATIKRLFAQKFNKDVTNPKEAKEAIHWFKEWMHTPEGKSKTGAMGQDLGDIFNLREWPVIEEAVSRRMPGLVQNQKLDDGAKMAADDGGLAEILAGWEPPTENPYAGFEGFAPKFQPGGQWADTLGQTALAASPAAALLGGLGLWRPWEQPAPGKPRKRRRKPAVKSAAVSDVTQAIYSQLPRIRLPDTLVGASMGALGGLGYDALRGEKPGKDRWRKRLGRALTGAGVGALGANVVGDRARRYISNTFVPAGYEQDPGGALMPKSLSHVWNAAVLDRPQHEVANPGVLKRREEFDKTPWVTEPEGKYSYRKDTMRNYVLPARMELFRRQLGVHTDDPTKDIWTPGPNDQLSVNLKNPRGVETAHRLMGTPAGGIQSEMFYDPAKLLADTNAAKNTGGKGPNRRTTGGELPPFGSITGGEQIPYRKTPGGGVEGSILDRWDYTLDPKENAFFKGNFGSMLSPTWRNAPLTEPISEYFHDDRRSVPKTNAETWKNLAGRRILDDVIAYRHPWITQRFRTAPDPTTSVVFNLPNGTKVRPQHLQMLTPEGLPQGEPITRNSERAFMKRPFAEKEGAAMSRPVMPTSMKRAAALLPPALPDEEEERKRRAGTWSAGDLGTAAAAGGILGGAGYAAGRGVEAVGNQLAFEPNPSWQLSEAANRVKNAPDMTGAVNEYMTRFPLVMNQPVYGKKTPFQLLRDTRIEGSMLRNAIPEPIRKSYFPTLWADDPNTRAHYTGFSEGPVRAYQTLLRERVTGPQAGYDILQSIEDNRAQALERAARNVLALDPNASPETFMKEYTKLLADVQVKPSPGMPSNILQQVGWEKPPHGGMLGWHTAQSGQTAATYRQLAEGLEQRLPAGQGLRAAEYFAKAKPLFNAGSTMGEDTGMTALAKKTTMPGQAASALGIWQKPPKPPSLYDRVWGRSKLPEAKSLHDILRGRLDAAVATAKRQLGHPPTPEEQVAIVKSVASGSPEADLGNLKIDQQLDVHNAANLYDRLNKVLSLPGHAARFAQTAAPLLKTVVPAAGLGLAGYGLYRYLHPPAKPKRKRGEMPESMRQMAAG